MTPKEVAAIAQFCRVQDQMLEIHLVDGSVFPEPWRLAYEDLRALVGEDDIAAATPAATGTPWANAVSKSLEDLVRTCPAEERDGILDTLEDILRAHRGEGDD